MWGVIGVLSSAKEIVVIESTEEELLLRWHSEHMEVVSIIDKLMWSLSPWVNWCLWNTIYSYLFMLVRSGTWMYPLRC